MKLLLFILSSAIVISCQIKPVPEESSQKEIAIEQDIEVDSVAFEIDSVTSKVDAAVSLSVANEMPDFAQYKDVNQKKKAFFDYLRPMILEENARIRKERARIKNIYSKYSSTGVISQKDSTWISAVANWMRMKSFSIASEKDRKTLLRKKDIVPVSMFLAQAANESSWGTSRFATEANNLFGQWCYTPGCGIVPSQRKANEKNEVRKFATINEAVRSFVRNINSYYAYKDLRVIREEIRNAGEIPDGTSLANGLTSYSIRGEEYVKEIQAMIRTNKLEIVE